MYPEEKYDAFTEKDQAYLDNLINTNVAYTNEGKQETYSLETLNLILSLGYKYAHAVIPAVRGNEKYVSAAGNYNDPDEGLNPDGLKAVKGKSVDTSVFTKANGNMAVGCKVYASNEKQAAINATDGNNNTRWETEFADPQWLYIDLGSKKEFDTVGFIWEGAYAAKYTERETNETTTVKPTEEVTTVPSEINTTLQETNPMKADANKIKKVKIKTAIRKQASSKVSIKIKKVVGVKGYEVRFIAKRKIILKKDLRNNKSRFSIASKKIKAKKAVYVQVRAYVFADSKKTYGQWSRKKKITIKK